MARVFSWAPRVFSWGLLLAGLATIPPLTLQPLTTPALAQTATENDATHQEAAPESATGTEQASETTPAQDSATEATPTEGTKVAEAPPASVSHPRRRARETAVEGLQHCAQEDFTTCRERLEAATELWDGHYQFTYLLAQAEARSGNPEAALERIEALAEAGYSLPLAEEPAFEPLRENPRFQGALAQIEQFAAREVVRSEVFAELTTPDLIPEGIAFDSATGNLFVSSIRHRKIVRRDAEGTVSDFATQDLFAVFGLAIDPRKRWLWAATGAVEAMADFSTEIDGQTALVAYDLANGKEVARHSPPRGDGPGYHGPGYRWNDLAIDSTGQIFATDNRLDGGVWKLTADGSLTLLTAPGSLRSPQGIAFDASGRLFVADYSFGIARVDPATGEVVFLDEPTAVSLIGVDGLAAHGDTLIAVQNGARPIRVLRLYLDETATRINSTEILEMGHPRWSEPTLGTVLGNDYLYVANSQWDRFDADFGLPPTDQLAAPLILRIDLR